MVTCAALCLVSVAGADDQVPAVHESLLVSRARIEAAFYDFDPVVYRNEAERLEQLADAADDWHVRYYQAVVHAHLAGYHLLTDEDRAGEHLERAERYLKDALEDHQHADIYALLASVLGRRIAVSPFRAVWLGPRSVEYLDRAQELDAANPRVYLEKGRSKLYQPAFVGGSASEARELFQEALRLSATYEEPDTLMLHVNPVPEIHAYLALTEHRLGNHDAAAEHARTALEMEPHYGFVLREVMNTLNGEE